MAIKIEMLRCFCAVAREGNLAGAAETLGRTISAVSMMLAQFEAHLGAPLFETDRKNRLTPLGVRVLEESEQAVEAFERSISAIARHALSEAGTVRIAAVPSASVVLLPRVIKRFRALRPEVRLEISDVDTAAVRRRLQRDEADIGIASNISGADLHGEILLVDRLGIICRRCNAAAGTRLPASWHFLEQQTLIVNPLCALVDHPVVRRLVEENLLSARNTTTMLSFVRNGLGATILPESAMGPGQDELDFLVPADPPAERRLVAISNVKRHPSPAAQVFSEILAEEAKVLAAQETADDGRQNLAERS